MSTYQAEPRPQHRDRGSASLQLVIVFPALFLLLLTIFQGALWYHTRTVALAAATSGLQATRAESGSSAQGRAAAAAFLTSAGATDSVRDLRISASRTQTRASVTVTARSTALIPGLPGPMISQTATGPVERFTNPQR